MDVVSGNWEVAICPRVTDAPQRTGTPRTSACPTPAACPHQTLDGSIRTISDQISEALMIGVKRDYYELLGGSTFAVGVGRNHWQSLCGPVLGALHIMKVLFVSPYPPAKDGIGTYTQALATGLRSGGDDIGVVLPRMQIGLREDVVGNLSARRAELAALCESLGSWNPDVIHVQFAIPAFGTRTIALLRFLRAIRAKSGAPIVVTAHEVTRETTMLGWFGRLIHRQLASRCDHVIVHTRAAHSELAGPVAVPAGKISVIPHPEATPPTVVSTAEDIRARFGLGDAQLLVAFGFIHVDKGLDDLVRALSILRRSDAALFSNWRLVIAGAVRPRQGPFRLFEFRDRLHLSRVLRMAARAKLRDNVVLTGYVPDADVAAWFQAAEAVVLPYRRTEQSGVAALANAFGVPVLASTAGGLGEQYAGSDWAFPPRRPQELANAITRFMRASPAERVGATSPHPAADLGSVLRATRDLYMTHSCWEGQQSVKLDCAE